MQTGLGGGRLLEFGVARPVQAQGYLPLSSELGTEEACKVRFNRCRG